MTYSGNRQTLLGGGGGEQGSRSAEKQLFELSFSQFLQQRSAQCNGAAPAAGAAGVDILRGVVKYQRSAVCQLSAQTDSFLPGKLQKQFLTQLPQIAGYDQVKGLRAGVQVLKMLPDGSQCRRG